MSRSKSANRLHHKQKSTEICIPKLRNPRLNPGDAKSYKNEEIRQAKLNALKLLSDSNRPTSNKYSSNKYQSFRESNRTTQERRTSGGHYVNTTNDTPQTERFLHSGQNTVTKADMLKNEIRNLKKQLDGINQRF